MDIITPFQFSLVYNAFSFTFATMTAATAFLWLSRSQVAPAYRTAVTISGLVTAIAAYHYLRIFESWNAAYTFKDGVIAATGFAFNDAYRYVDWLLTVPLLLVELVLVMRLSPEQTSSKTVRLGSAAALMIVLGYPGEIAADIPTRALWGTLSAIPFVYIVWELFRGLGESIEQQPVAARDLVRRARLLTFASWGFYPIVYMAPYANLTGATATTVIQLGYTIADIVAKAGVGVLIFMISVRKSQVEAHSPLVHAE
ncbi:bacteriorhodopsin-like [Sphingomonas faeni]|uniref:bacteriorhodopsin-like n=1 Tax=Sphingomonas faeni TaxID=185950 RepID=UPI002412EE50|nr:bacteriorhodopsin-like [Sphingomonas faeni]